MLKLSVYDLAYEYIIRNFKSNEIDNCKKAEIILEIEKALSTGITTETLIHKIITMQNQNYKMFFNNLKNINKEVNLLSPNKFYYHKELRITPPPPMKYLDLESGTIKETNEKYYLEIVASYTINNIIEYINSKKYIKILAQNKTKLQGAIKNLLKRYDIDYFLFLIDTTEAGLEIKEKYPKTLFDIEQYTEEATENYHNKISTDKANNNNKIIFKQRKKIGNIKCVQKKIVI